jgi:hypothetical protein
METTVNQKHLVASLVEKANNYRNFARWVAIGKRCRICRIYWLWRKS